MESFGMNQMVEMFSISGRRRGEWRWRSWRSRKGREQWRLHVRLGPAGRRNEKLPHFGDGETPYPGEDYFVPDGAGSYMWDAGTETSEEEKAMDPEERVGRVEEIDFEHPLIFMQDDRPGVVVQWAEDLEDPRSQCGRARNRWGVLRGHGGWKLAVAKAFARKNRRRRSPSRPTTTAWQSAWRRCAWETGSA